MTGDRSQLTNSVHKFLGTVKFGNDHIAKIIGIVSNSIPQQPCNLPQRDNWDILFQPIRFTCVYIDQDAPSTSIPLTQDQEHSPIMSQGFEESPKTLHFRDDPLHESLHEDSTSQGSSSNIRPTHTPFESLGRWTKDHPIENVIRDLLRSVH
ncbi:hypothetical protein Tco_0810354 [Tanacetum coccineum]